MAVRERRQVHLRHCKMDGEETERRFAPYGLVCRHDHWYAIGHCYLRDSQRLFRLDRVRDVTTLDDTFDRPLRFDVLTAGLTSLGSVPRGLPVEVTLETTLQEARRHISANVAALEELAGGGVLLRGCTDNSDWIARMLVRVGCRLEIRQSPELRESLRRHAAQIASWADRDN